MDLSKIEQAVAAAIERRTAPDEKFYEFVHMYEARLCSITGIAIDTLACDDDPEASDAYWDDMWEKYQTGADAVDLADEIGSRYPPELRPGLGRQSPEEFRKAWLEDRAAQERALEALEIP